MKVYELIERLQEIADVYPDSEVMIATQPGYPIAETLLGVTREDAIREYAEDGPNPVIWLVSGGQSTSHEVSPYAPAWVFEAAS